MQVKCPSIASSFIHFSMLIAVQKEWAQRNAARKYMSEERQKNCRRKNSKTHRPAVKPAVRWISTHTHIHRREKKMRKTAWTSGENILIGFLFQKEYADTLCNTTLTLAHLVWNNVEVKPNMRFSQSEKKSTKQFMCSYSVHAYLVDAQMRTRADGRQTSSWMCTGNSTEIPILQPSIAIALPVPKTYEDAIWFDTWTANKCLSHFHLSPVRQISAQKFLVDHQSLTKLRSFQICVPMIERKLLANWFFFCCPFAISQSINFISIDLKSGFPLCGCKTFLKQRKWESVNTTWNCIFVCFLCCSLVTFENEEYCIYKINETQKKYRLKPKQKESKRN